MHLVFKVALQMPGLLFTVLHNQAIWPGAQSWSPQTNTAADVSSEVLYICKQTCCREQRATYLLIIVYSPANGRKLNKMLNKKSKKK